MLKYYVLSVHMTEIVFTVRLEIAALTAEFKMGAAIPYIKYTDDELRTWNACFTNLLQLYPTHACAKYNEIRQDMFSKCGYRVDNVPRLEDVSKYVQCICELSTS